MSVTVSAPPDLHALVAEIKAQAHALGFDLAGVAPADPSAYREYFRQWLADGQAAEMHYLEDRFEERTNLANYFPGAKSAICVALNYHATLQEPQTRESARGRVARYALGEDYHEVIKPRLHAMADWLARRVPGVITRSAVDTAPVMEKELAVRAGIGWMGKNTCVIHPRIGSWILLGEIITDLPLPPDVSLADHCGSCTRCIDACPTGAITDAYQLDARLCISYLTIEHRGPIDEELRSKTDDWLFGCDVCQEVCPFNRRPPQTAEPTLLPRFPDGSLDVHDVLHWSAEDYQQVLRRSAMKRVKLPLLHRNAAIVKRNLDSRED